MAVDGPCIRYLVRFSWCIALKQRRCRKDVVFKRRMPTGDIVTIISSSIFIVSFLSHLL